MIVETAPAKLNLFLHVGGLRPDRLHDLASLFVFADQGDVIRAEAARELSLEIEGPFAAPLAGEPLHRNLVWRAAEALRGATGVSFGARIVLEKNLPIASGVGGGSADAAATLRALVRLWKLEISQASLARIGFALGADVPACLDRAPIVVSGAGERLSQGPSLPPIWACLVNPLVPMPTGPVFRAFDRANPAPQAPMKPDLVNLRTYDRIRALFSATRNDLQAVASRREPVIEAVQVELANAPGAIAVRMSGSGATMFGLFSSGAAAARAERRARARGWWAMTAAIARPGSNPHRSD